MKLHLGCGPRFFPGWVHVDIADYEHIDYKANVDNLSMFEDQSVSIIYASHVLEYFDIFEAKKVLTGWKRVLQPKGIIRISVPDFDALIKVYSMTKGNIDKIIGPLYGRMLVGQSGDEFIYHRTIYNFSKLSALLKSVGFEDIKKYNWQDLDTSMYDDHSQAYYPHMDKVNGIQISLNVEALNV